LCLRSNGNETCLDKLVHNVTGLKGALKALLKLAMKQIPGDFHKSTSPFLYATAGVRRLPNEDSKWLLDNGWMLIGKVRVLFVGNIGLRLLVGLNKLIYEEGIIFEEREYGRKQTWMFWSFSRGWIH
jgi:hypothetical protein